MTKLCLISYMLYSPITGHETDYRHLLGGIQRNSAGHIISATSLMINFIVHINVSHVKDNKLLETKIGVDYNYITDNVYLWEGAFNDKMAELVEKFTDNSTIIYYSASRSTSDTNIEQLHTAVGRMIIGNILMFVYLQLVLSRVSWVELRVRNVVKCVHKTCFFKYIFFPAPCGHHRTSEYINGSTLRLWHSIWIGLHYDILPHEHTIFGNGFR
jgi:putative effector of murein hydrolase LrgA (UPF0299 family)